MDCDVEIVGDFSMAVTERPVLKIRVESVLELHAGDSEGLLLCPVVEAVCNDVVLAVIDSFERNTQTDQPQASKA